MTDQIKNKAKLTKILWADFILGSSNGLIGLFFYSFFAPILGLPEELLIWISSITVLYSLFALRLALMTILSATLVRILVSANWIWTLISLVIIWFHFSEATILGQFFLILQIIIVGGLAWLEANQLQKS